MPSLTTCPRPDCTATVRHFYDGDDVRHACMDRAKYCRKHHNNAATPVGTCYLPRVPEPASSPVKTADNSAAIVLPTVEEAVSAICAAWASPATVGNSTLAAARAVLGLIAARLPVWQPVEPGTVIKAGTVTRIELDDRDAHEEVTRSDYTLIDLNRYPGHLARFYLDPRTVPAEPVEPVDPRAELLAEELHNHGGCEEVWPCCSVSTVEHYRNDARDLLARLDAVRDDA